MQQLIAKIKKNLREPKWQLINLLNKTACLWPDKAFIKAKYRLVMGKPLNLKNPQTFNEKLQWLKLHNRRPLYTTVVDKVKAKEYVASIIGEEYIIPTLGVWERGKDVDFDSLPEKFVIKCNHNSGTGLYICRDKSTMDADRVRKYLNKGLKQNYFLQSREWPYKNVPRRILAEELLEYKDNPKESIVDYKFTCYDGYVDNVMLCLDRGTGDTKFYFFDRDWNLLRLNLRGKAAPEGFTLPKPKMMDEMFGIAERLSKGFPYVRVDLYCVNDKIYFGEMTLFPDSGWDPNLLPETEAHFGKMLDLNKVKGI